MNIPERPGPNRAAFLDRHPVFPILFLVLLPFIVHVPLWMTGRSVDPIWFVSGVTHGSPSLPSKPFTDPTVGYDSEALGHLSAWDWVHGILPWWNPFNGVGMPLAGELQPGSFFLPFTFLLLLPEGLLWQKIAMQAIAGVTTYALLRELGLSRLASVMGGALYGLNGTFAWSPGIAAVYCTETFFPLLLWGIERARKEGGGAASILAIGSSVTYSLLAGFPEPAYISGLLALVWGLYRLISERNRLALVRRAIAGLVLGFLAAMPLMIAFLDYILQSYSFSMHRLAERSLPWPALATIAMPYVYGLPGMNFASATLSAVGAGVGGYAGVLVLLLTIVGLGFGKEHRGLRILLAAWIVVIWAKTFGIQPIMGLMNHLPMMKYTMFYRYAAPSWECPLILLAAMGLDAVQEDGAAFKSAFGAAACLLALSVFLAWPTHAWWHRPATANPLLFCLLFAALCFSLALLAAASLVWKKLRGNQRNYCLAALAVFEAAALFVLPMASNVGKTGIDTDAIRFLHEHQGLYRNYTLGPLLPNYSAYFHIASIDHNAIPVPKLWADYVDSRLLPGFSSSAGVIFWPPAYGEGVGERDLSRDLPSYLQLGVSYILTYKGRSPAPEIEVPETEAAPFIPQSESGGVSAFSKFLQRICARMPFVGCPLARAVMTFQHRSAGRAPGIQSPDSSLEFPLAPGQSTTFRVTAPTPPVDGFPITGVAILPATLAADGKITIRICGDGRCRNGAQPLSTVEANSILRIGLDQPMTATAGEPLSVTVGLQDSSSPLLFRTAAAIPTPLTQLPGVRPLQMVFSYGSALAGAHKVYSDSLMDIWKLPNPAPYYQVIQGGPCILTGLQRDSADADCSAPAVLLRRELFMPGWTVTAEGRDTPPVQQTGIFQSTALSAGKSRLRYSYTPPHMPAAWIACGLGLAGLLVQVIRIFSFADTQRIPAHAERPPRL